MLKTSSHPLVRSPVRHLVLAFYCLIFASIPFVKAEYSLEMRSSDCPSTPAKCQQFCKSFQAGIVAYASHSSQTGQYCCSCNFGDLHSVVLSNYCQDNGQCRAGIHELCCTGIHPKNQVIVSPSSKSSVVPNHDSSASDHIAGTTRGHSKQISSSSASSQSSRISSQSSSKDNGVSEETQTSNILSSSILSDSMKHEDRIETDLTASIIPTIIPSSETVSSSAESKFTEDIVSPTVSSKDTLKFDTTDSHAIPTQTTTSNDPAETKTDSQSDTFTNEVPQNTQISSKAAISTTTTSSSDQETLAQPTIVSGILTRFSESKSVTSEENDHSSALTTIVSTGVVDTPMQTPASIEDDITKQLDMTISTEKSSIISSESASSSDPVVDNSQAVSQSPSNAPEVAIFDSPQGESKDLRESFFKEDVITTTTTTTTFIGNHSNTSAENFIDGTTHSTSIAMDSSAIASSTSSPASPITSTDANSNERIAAPPTITASVNLSETTTTATLQDDKNVKTVTATVTVSIFETIRTTITITEEITASALQTPSSQVSSSNDSSSLSKPQTTNIMTSNNTLDSIPTTVNISIDHSKETQSAVSETPLEKTWTPERKPPIYISDTTLLTTSTSQEESIDSLKTIQKDPPSFFVTTPITEQTKAGPPSLPTETIITTTITDSVIHHDRQQDAKQTSNSNNSDATIEIPLSTTVPSSHVNDTFSSQASSQSEKTSSKSIPLEKTHIVETVQSTVLTSVISSQPVDQRTVASRLRDNEDSVIEEPKTTSASKPIEENSDDSQQQPSPSSSLSSSSWMTSHPSVDATMTSHLMPEDGPSSHRSSWISTTHPTMHTSILSKSATSIHSMDEEMGGDNEEGQEHEEQEEAGFDEEIHETAHPSDYETSSSFSKSAVFVDSSGPVVVTHSYSTSKSVFAAYKSSSGTAPRSGYSRSSSRRPSKFNKWRTVAAAEAASMTAKSEENSNNIHRTVTIPTSSLGALPTAQENPSAGAAHRVLSLWTTVIVVMVILLNHVQG